MERKISDLVQEQRPAVGGLELPGLPLVGARVGALFGAEELALDQVSGSEGMFTVK